MNRYPEISMAFGSAFMQDTLGNLIDKVPEIKHEVSMSSILAACLQARTPPVPVRREVKVGNRRIDMIFNQGEQVEAKYHLEFDLDSVEDAVKNISLIQQNISQGKPPKNWSSGEAVIRELLRMNRDSHFLWSVCAREVRIPNRCMATKGNAWAAFRCGNVEVRQTARGIFRSLASQMASAPPLNASGVLTHHFLPDISKGSSTIFNVLFYRQ